MQENVGRPDWVDSNLYPFHDNWVEIDGNSIHYVDEGPRDAPLLLFIHPGPGWSFTYRYHIQHLSDQVPMHRARPPRLWAIRSGRGLRLFSPYPEPCPRTVRTDSQLTKHDCLEQRWGLADCNTRPSPTDGPRSRSRCRRHIRLVNQGIPIGSLDATPCHKPALPPGPAQIIRFARLLISTPR